MSDIARQSAIGGEDTLATQLRLEVAGDGVFRRTVDARWTNGTSRIFGGYTAALSLAACGLSTQHQTLCSAHVTFLEAVYPGEITFQVFPERSGRSLSALRVVGMQDSKPALVAWAWMGAVSAASQPVEAHEAADPGDPELGTERPWLQAHCGNFHQWLETRTIDYPATPESFDHGDGGHSVDLWTHPRPGTLAPGLQSQLYDILIADAHLSEGAMRALGSALRHAVSLDLHLQWSSAALQPGWRRIRASSPSKSLGMTMCTATLHDRHGRPCATASQQVWCRA